MKTERVKTPSVCPSEGRADTSPVGTGEGQEVGNGLEARSTGGEGQEASMVVMEGGDSAIEWCDSSWEVTAGCTKVSSGCANCYAERVVGTRMVGLARSRRERGEGGTSIDVSLEVINQRIGKSGLWNGRVRELAMNLEQPLRRKKPTVYFVNSRSDLFHEGVDFAYIDRVFAVMALCPQHRFLVLTKRPGRMKEYLTESGSIGHRIYRQVSAWLDDGADGFLGDRGWDRAHDLAGRSCSGERFDFTAWKTPLPNVWLGTSVEDQAAADARVPELLACPAAGRFLSVEPLLGPVDLDHRELLCKTWRRGLTIGIYLDWVIVGGESGPGARVCDLAWIESVVEQCRSSGVPVFVKQMGAMSRRGDEVIKNTKKGGAPMAWPVHLRVREVPDGLRV